LQIIALTLWSFDVYITDFLFVLDTQVTSYFHVFSRHHVMKILHIRITPPPLLGEHSSQIHTSMTCFWIHAFTFGRALCSCEVSHLICSIKMSLEENLSLGRHIFIPFVWVSKYSTRAKLIFFLFVIVLTGMGSLLIFSCIWSSIVLMVHNNGINTFLHGNTLVCNAKSSNFLNYIGIYLSQTVYVLPTSIMTFLLFYVDVVP
jgi:hypothetical protein